MSHRGWRTIGQRSRGLAGCVPLEHSRRAVSTSASTAAAWRRRRRHHRVAAAARSWAGLPRRAAMLRRLRASTASRLGTSAAIAPLHAACAEGANARRHRTLPRGGHRSTRSRQRPSPRWPLLVSRRSLRRRGITPTGRHATFHPLSTIPGDATHAPSTSAPRFPLLRAVCSARRRISLSLCPPLCPFSWGCRPRTKKTGATA